MGFMATMREKAKDQAKAEAKDQVKAEVKEPMLSAGWWGVFALISTLALTSTFTSIAFAKHTASRIVYGPTHLYVTLKGERQFYVIDRKDPRQVSKVPVGSPPCGGFLAEDGGAFYIALGEADAIAVVDTQSNKIRHTISLKDKKGGYMDPGGMALSPDGKTIYVANESGNNLSVIDLASRKLRSNIPLGLGPQDVAMTPDGRSIYVTDFYSVSVVDTATGKVTDTLILKNPKSDASRTMILPDGEEVLRGPRDIVMAPDGRAAYVAIEDTGEIAIIDTQKNRIHRTIKVGSYPGGLALSPDGRYLYIAHRDKHEISVLDTKLERVVQKIPVGADPWDIAVSSDGLTVYVVNQGSSDISIIDSESYKVLSTVLLGALKGVFPRGLRRMFFVWRKEKRRIRRVPFGSAIFAVLFLTPFSFTMMDRHDIARVKSNSVLAGMTPGSPAARLSRGDPTGKIVFESRRTGNWEIYLMNPDGTDQTRLTHTRADNRAPFWSPDGSHPPP